MKEEITNMSCCGWNKPSKIAMANMERELKKKIASIKKRLGYKKFVVFPMPRLFNEVISKVYIDSSKTILAFMLKNKDIVAYHAYGDCCSNSWINHIAGIDAIIGGKVAGVRKSFLGGNEDKEYNYKITTDKGVCDIEFRNLSNGYYGGHLEDIFNEEDIYQVKALKKDF